MRFARPPAVLFFEFTMVCDTMPAHAWIATTILRLYDRLEHDTAESVRLHLCADLAYQGKLVRFIENHDEPRALSVFSPQKERAAAVTIATIPGAKLFHEGQFEGRKVRLPVFLGRRSVEPADPDLQAFYGTLLKAASLEGLRNGRWQLCDRTGWPDNASWQNLVAWSWCSDGEYLLAVVNRPIRCTNQ